ncbi:hypothetical protein B0T26DRAFT_703970 [Lasiosphaeria miniovina]|uniref:Uncharacterized protein n=1 Tax=Lasiosphaeria miniovina TaxID=1954250 RepID=A0AA40AVJ9_9PEZI|nr:uncharacterized protein B0T26DRAFT_703970 [Lasiosphaeria miniovina]KAK0722787.1 hypothetical protein B0T26DRAFT_703970 [Lasiosphaeria miniovina]
MCGCFFCTLLCQSILRGFIPPFSFFFHCRSTQHTQVAHTWAFSPPRFQLCTYMPYLTYIYVIANIHHRGICVSNCTHI